ncbi:MAG TPA: Ig-like domain-containing protein, partial [Bacillota bacterium]|nr:Ig-like domain-containing protein [Bacillota bacterium]
AYSWLTDTIILNGNSSLGSITKNLALRVEGPEGTNILWRSTNENIAAPDGKIKQPSIEEGSQPVTLTAEISRGSAKLEKSFYIFVLAEATDAEAAALDHKWLTEKLILDQNTDKNSVTDSLKLHTLGPMGSAISWTSSDTNLVAEDGKVSRPSFTQGRQGVTLTAVVSRGDTSLQKTFNLTVLPSEPTDEEAVEADTLRLSALHTLGQNWSQYSITKNLSLPGTLYYGTSITWTSDKPELISDEGIVTRPEYMEGNKWVTLTAVLSKGGKNASKSLTYVVLQKPDIDAPQITETIPLNNSMNVLWDTRELKVAFSEEIKRGTLPGIAESNTLGAELQGLGIQQISVRISGKSLIITPIKYLDAGLNELIIPEGAVTDMSGNPMEEFRLSFNVEQKQVNKIEIVSFTPQDMEKNVSLRPSISFGYSYDNIEKGSSFYDISIRSKAGRVIPSDAFLSGNEVYLNLDKALEPATIYEISVPAGAVRDRFENVSIGKLIQFRT